MLRFGIAGFGLHAVRRLMPGFKGAQRCTVTALSRRDMTKAQASAGEYGITHAFDSVGALARCSEVDAVLVTSPNALHLPDVLSVVPARKHILLEKPMGMSADEARQMLAAADKAGIKFGVAQVFRFEKTTRRLRELIAGGEIGRVVFARSEFSFPGWEHHRTWLTDRKIAGGGPIADVGIHCIDALRFILRHEVTAVQAFGHSDDRSGEVEAAASLNLAFTSGTLGVVQVSFRAPYRTPLEFVGEKGTLRIQDGLTVDRPVTLELLRDGKLAHSEELFNDDAYARQVDGFADWVEGRSDFPAPATDGVVNQTILDAAYDSLRSSDNHAVSLHR
jgi:predicted dehydrogenase